MQVYRSGIRAGFLHVDQVGLCYPTPADDPVNHRVKSQNLAAVWPVYRAAGARCLIAVGSVTSRETVSLYAGRTLPTSRTCAPHSPAHVQAVNPPMISPSAPVTLTENDPWSFSLVPVAAKLYSSRPLSRTSASSGSRSPTLSSAAERSSAMAGSPTRSPATRYRSSGHCSLDQFGNLPLYGRGPLLYRERHGPHVPVVEVRSVLELECRVPHVEFARVLEGDDDLAVLVGVGGHPIPGLRQQLRGGSAHRRMDALGHGAILWRHLCDRVEDRLQPVGLFRALLALSAQLRGALLHRGTLCSSEAAGPGLGTLRGHCHPTFRPPQARRDTGQLNEG